MTRGPRRTRAQVWAQLYEALFDPEETTADESMSSSERDGTTDPDSGTDTGPT